MNAPGQNPPGTHRNAPLLVLEAAIDALVASTGIVGTIVQLDSNSSKASATDAVLELSVDGERFPYRAYIRQIDRMGLLHLVQQRFANSLQSNLLVAPRISVEFADKCRELGVQFIDANGNAYLHGPGMLVIVKGQRPGKGSALNDALGDGASAGGTSAARLIFALLCLPALLNAPYRRLSEVAGVSLGAIGPVFNDLAKRGFITNTKAERRFLEKEKLLTEWVTTYPLKLRPKLAPRRFRAPDRDWWKSVDLLRFDAVWGGEVAADKLTNYLRPEKITIYMDSATMRQNLGQLVVQQKLRADPDGDIEVLEKFWDLPTDGAAPSDTPPLLTYADLVASMEPRNLEVATMIYQQLDHAN